MSGFNSFRLFESFVAAIFGAAAYDSIKTKIHESGNHLETLRKFHRAILIAEQAPSFSEETGTRYLTRIAALSESKKRKYIRACLQPSDSAFDERISALLIVNHATKTDEEWNLLISAASLDGRDFQEQIPELAEYILRKGKRLPDAVDVVKSRYQNWRVEETKAYRARVKQRHPVVKFFMKFL